MAECCWAIIYWAVIGQYALGRSLLDRSNCWKRMVAEQIAICYNSDTRVLWKTWHIHQSNDRRFRWSSAWPMHINSCRGIYQPIQSCFKTRRSCRSYNNDWFRPRREHEPHVIASVFSCTQDVPRKKTRDVRHLHVHVHVQCSSACRLEKKIHELCSARPCLCPNAWVFVHYSENLQNAWDFEPNACEREIWSKCVCHTPNAWDLAGMYRVLWILATNLFNKNVELSCVLL